MEIEANRTKSLAFDAIERSCQSFATFTLNGDALDLHGLLSTVDVAAQPVLLRNLLHLELEQRRARGEQPAIEEYLQRFPDHEPVVRRAMVETVTRSPVLGGASAVEATRTRSLAASDQGSAEIPVSQLGDYRLLRELGRGGMGTVFEAKHSKHGHHVALKTLPSVSGDRLHAFKREFRSMAGINHPNLIGLQTLEADGPFWFLTMELIQGTDFVSFVRPAGELDESKLRSALTQLVAGVLALHGRHIIHRDLKPSNVMVNEQGLVKILDFGLVFEEAGTAGCEEHRIAGTPAYMAPEQAAGERVSSASDWYAVGVMLYEALTKRRPFQGTPMDLLRIKQSEDPPAIADKTLPSDLCELGFRLLARNPVQRPDALEIATAVAGGNSVASGAPRAWGSEQLIGRDGPLELLQQAFELMQNGAAATTVLVKGMSGEGKTSLVEKFLEPFRKDKRFTVLSGRCYDRESVPFKALDGVIDALTFYWQSLGHQEASRLIPDDLDFLVHLFPVLQRVEVVGQSRRSDVSAFDRAQVRQRAFAAMRNLLRHIAARTPLLIFTDDLQWGDGDSAEALLQVLKGPDSPAILWIGTVRSDEAQASRFLQAWDNLRVQRGIELDRQEIQLAPLTVEQCRELMIARLGTDSPDIRRRADEFAEKTGGNPFLLLELIDCFDPETNSFETLEMPEVVKRKLDRLPADAARLLEVIAVSGKSLSLEEASQTAGHESVPFSTLTQMRNENLVRLTGHAELPLVDTYHDKIRETMLANMSAGVLRQRHIDLGEAIETGVGGDASKRLAELALGLADRGEPIVVPRGTDLAYHFDAAGVGVKALVYATLAAETAKRQFALDVAAEYFQIAERHIGAAPRPVRYRIALGHVETLVLAGKFDQTSEILPWGQAAAETTLDQVRLDVLRAEIEYRQKSITESVRIYESMMRRLGLWVPRTRIAQTAALAWECAVQGIHMLVPTRWIQRDRSLNEAWALKLKSIDRVCHPYQFCNSYKQLWACCKALNLSETTNSPRQQAIGCAVHGVTISVNLGWYARGHKYLERSLNLARERGDVSQEANSLRLLGYAQLASGKLALAVENLEQTAKLFESKVSDYWQMVLSRFWASAAYCRQGRFLECGTVVRDCFDLATRNGQDRLAQMVLDPWSRAAGGNLPFDNLSQCFRLVPDDYTSRIQALLAETQWHLYHRRTAEGVRIAEEALAIVRRHWVFNLWTSSTFSLLARALREHSLAISVNDSSASRRAAARAMRVARWAVRASKLLEIDAPAAMRELCLALSLKGQTGKALKFAKRSCQIAESQGALYELAQSRLVLGQLRQQLGDTSAQAMIDQATEALGAYRLQMDQAATGTRSP